MIKMQRMCGGILLSALICGLWIPAVSKAQEKAKPQKSLLDQHRHMFRTFGAKSKTKIQILSGPKAVKMNRGNVPGKEWLASSGMHRFKLTIQDAVKMEVGQLVKQLERLPPAYIRGCEVVSDRNENGVAVYTTLDGAAAHGSKDYINMVPKADALVIAHEMGHTLEQAATEKDSKMLDKWAEARKADKISVSKYGDTVNHEDLAEFALVYALCLDAGEKHLEKLKALSPQRYALWEKILYAR